ncbi:MAG: YicC/YloC family endoribonuclease, partial [Planctomycetota bacterium]
MTVRSMTGQGRAESTTTIGLIRVELRSVNNRGFKCTIRCPDELSAFSPRIEKLIRGKVSRGSVNVELRSDQSGGTEASVLDVARLAEHLKACREAVRMAGLDDSQVRIDVGSLAAVPGVLKTASADAESVSESFEEISAVIEAALDDLVAMRGREGEHMAETLKSECEGIENHVKRIETLTPQAAERYRERLETKVKRLLDEFESDYNQVDLLRETQIYADRADVTEELTRLESHLSQFRAVLGEASSEFSTQEPTGRKLDFIIQEMFRESNTIGSKTPLASVSESVVEVKCAIE